jgi:hypothetical protein
MDLRDDAGKPVRVSGAFDLDMSKVVEEAARRAAESMAGQIAPALAQYAEHLLQALMPALTRINRTVEHAAGLAFPAGLMSDADARATLASMLPATVSADPGAGTTGQQIADFQLQRLTEAGYAVVPVAGAALEHAIKVAQHRQRLAEYERGERDPRVDATARADARLAQARHAGQEDSWHEQDQ